MTAPSDFAPPRRSLTRKLQRLLVPETVRHIVRDVQYRLAEPQKMRKWQAERDAGKTVVHMLHVQKTGGTALIHVLKSQPRPGDFSIHCRGHGAGLHRVPSGDKIIIFLRHPVTRFVSGFKDRLKEGAPRYDAPWTFGEFRAFRRFRTPDALACALSSTNQSERRAAERAMRSIRHVNASLSRWLRSEEYLKERREDFLFVGHQEMLDDDFEHLKAILGLSEDAALPQDPVKAHKSPASPDTQLSERAIENLRTWYREDLRLIQICCEFGEYPRTFSELPGYR